MARYERRLGPLADAILNASNIREQSWNPVKKTYKLHIEDACKKAHDNIDIQELSCLLLTACWNDAIIWAKDNTEARKHNHERNSTHGRR